MKLWLVTFWRSLSVYPILIAASSEEAAIGSIYKKYPDATKIFAQDITQTAVDFVRLHV